MQKPIRLVAAVAFFCGGLASAPPAPPPPAAYGVVVRYQINAFQNERIAQFNEMLKALTAAGFKRDASDEPPEDEAANAQQTRLKGTVPSAAVRQLLRQRHVRSVLLVPAGEKLPADPNQAVRVHVELASGFPPARQQMLHAQVGEVLAVLKFNEAVGYDDRAATRMVGSLPVGQLDLVLNDLRANAAGEKMPAPFATINPIRGIEVLPGLPLPAARPATTAAPAGQEKLSDDLRAVVADKARAEQPLRFEVLLSAVPASGDKSWQRALRLAAPGLAIEGQLGTVITVMAMPNQAGNLAALPTVVGARLPRTATVAEVPANADLAGSLKATGLDRLHGKGFRGKGTRIAVIGADFRGWRELVGKDLPAGTRLIDLTRERNRTVEADALAAGAGPGQATLFARVAAKAAPEAQLVLLRVDPAAPYMVQSIARAINGETARSLALEQRGLELDEDRALFDFQRRELVEERRAVFANLRQEPESQQRLEDYEKKQAAFDAAERDYSQRLQRYLAHEKDLLDLKGVRVVANSLAWDAGHPAGGASALSRSFDDSPICAALWLQAAGKKSAAWTALFRDANGNGAMEFAGPATPLPADSWTSELNFLSWRGLDDKEVRDLPAGARVRATVVWREAHDPELQRIGQDPFAQPLSPLKLVILRQADPSGNKQPADDLEVVAQSVGAPRRLGKTPSSGTFEQSVEWKVEKAGRYAVRVEGRISDSSRPGSMPTLPALRRGGEVRPRIVLETLHGAGTVSWRDFVGDSGVFGMPADAKTVVTVDTGTALLARDELTTKPDLIAPPGVASDGVAVALGAGLAASTRTAGAPLNGWLRELDLRPGAPLTVPERWLRR